MVRFLHLSLERLTAYRSDTGVYANGRPKGLWYGHDLSWVRFMQSKQVWSPNLSGLETRTPYPLVSLYHHVLDGAPLPSVAEGETLDRPPTGQVHFVYEFPLAGAMVDGGAASTSKILRVSATSFATLNALVRPLREEWYRESALGDIYSIVRGLKNADPETAALRTLFKAPKAPIYTFVEKGADRLRIAEALLAGEVPLNAKFRELEHKFWKSFMPTLQSSWGGLDVDESLFAHAPAAAFLKSLAWDAPSGVLFHPAEVLKTANPETHLRAMVRWGPTSAPAPEGVPLYEVGLTTTGELRSLARPSGGRRRRTRRRMLKNPKTLKKRIR